MDSSSPSALWHDDVVGAYLNSTRQAAEAALASLNTAVNWSLTLTLGVMAFTIQFIFSENATGFPTLFFSLLILAVTMAMIAHFAIRTAKGYINVVRFAALERAALAQIMISSSIPLDEKLRSYTNFAEFVQTYHMLWKSPVSLPVVFRKVLFEFGYLYHGLLFWLCQLPHRAKRASGCGYCDIFVRYSHNIRDFTVSAVCVWTLR